MASPSKHTHHLCSFNIKNIKMHTNPFYPVSSAPTEHSLAVALRQANLLILRGKPPITSVSYTLKHLNPLSGFKSPSAFCSIYICQDPRMFYPSQFINDSSLECTPVVCCECIPSHYRTSVSKWLHEFCNAMMLNNTLFLQKN